MSWNKTVYLLLWRLKIQNCEKVQNVKLFQIPWWGTKSFLNSHSKYKWISRANKSTMDYLCPVYDINGKFNFRCTWEEWYSQGNVYIVVPVYISSSCLSFRSFNISKMKKKSNIGIQDVTFVHFSNILCIFSKWCSFLSLACIL